MTGCLWQGLGRLSALLFGRPSQFTPPVSGRVPLPLCDCFRTARAAAKRAIAHVGGPSHRPCGHVVDADEREGGAQLGAWH